MSEFGDNLSAIKIKIIETIVDLSGKNVDINTKSIVNWFGSGDYLKDLQRHTDCQAAENELDSIVKKLREFLPWNAVLPTEKIKAPTKGSNSDCKDETTHHLDGFLYNDSEVDDILEEKGLTQRYCGDCGSTNVKEIMLISHSLSRQKLQYVFKVMLPKDCSSKKILDVGSRIGAVLYGAYFYTNSPQIFGVELNKDLCDIQNKIISLHSMEKRIKVVNGDISEQGDIVATSDIVILNNVFEFFMDPEAQINVWRFLRKTLKKGCLLITVPSVEESLDDLEIYDEFSNWVQTIPTFQDNHFDFDEDTMTSFHDMYLYEVK